MKYLVRYTKPSARAHIWTGIDTACRMASTGGLGSLKGYEITVNQGKRLLCQNCQSVLAIEELRKAPELDRPLSIMKENVAVTMDAAALWLLRQTAKKIHTRKVKKDRNIKRAMRLEKRRKNRGLPETRIPETKDLGLRAAMQLKVRKNEINAYKTKQLGTFGAASPVRRIDPKTGQYID